MSTHRPSTHRLPALLAVGLACLAPAAIAGAAPSDGARVAVPTTRPVDGAPTTRPVKPDPVAAPAVLMLTTLEDSPIALGVGGGFEVEVAPSHGTLLTAQDPPVYLPHPDFNGVDEFVLSFAKGEVPVVIKVRPVNDAPTFTVGPGLAHVAGDAGLQEIKHWATDLMPGPAEEQWSQRMWFRSEAVEDPQGVVAALHVAPDGTLAYRLSGRPGTARWSVQAFDDGGIRDGGIEVSAPQMVSIGVGVEADLAIKIIPLSLESAFEDLRAHQLVVSNLSDNDATGVRVVDLVPVDAERLAWQCQGHDGGACPKVASGRGAVDLLVDMPGHSMVVFTVTGVTAAHDGASHSAFVEPPKHVHDPDLANNEASR